MVLRFFDFRRKAKQLIWLISALCFVQQSTAAEIVMEAYQYPSEALAESPIRFSERETFVICDCPEAPDLLRLLVAPPLVLKTSSSKKESIEGSALKTSTPKTELKLNPKSKPIKYTLPFAFDSDRLSPDALKKLNKIIKKIKFMPGEKRIVVLGYTNDIGTKPYNDGLSLRRAESVARHFTTQGLPALEVEVEGKGSCCPVSRKRALNRRVEIRVEIIDTQGEQS